MLVLYQFQLVELSLVDMTNYHSNKVKKKIEKYFEEEFDNLKVVGFPFYRKDVFSYTKPLPYEKKDGILINGRLEQSNVGLIDRIKKTFQYENISILHARNRKEYYNLLNKAKVVISLKIEETFGIGQLEAYVLGSIPLSPNNYAYPEVIENETLLYTDEEDLMDKLAYLLRLDQNSFQMDIEKYEQTISSCVKNL